MGQDFGFAGDVQGDSQHTPPKPSTSTPFMLDFTTLNDLGIISRSHFDRPPYNTRPHMNDSDETQPPKDNMGDEAGAV